MGKRGDERNSRAWRRRRAFVIATTPRPVICWRCEQEITNPETADLGHLSDLATAQPGAAVRVALEHPACNRAAGQLLGQELTRKPPTIPRQQAPWVSARPDLNTQ